MDELYNRICGVIPDKPGLVFNDEETSYGQLREKVRSLTTAFVNIGITKDDRIAVIIPTRPEFIYVWLAASKIGAAIVGLNFRYTGEEIQYMVNNSEASALVCIRDFNDTHYPDLIDSIRPLTPSIQKVIYLDGGASPAEDSLDVMLTTPADNEMLDALENEDKAVADNFIIYTSGTTGKPKGVVIKQRNILAMMRPWLKNMEIDETDNVLCMLPLNHVGGGTITALTALAAGAKLVLLDIFNPPKVIELLQEHKITAFGGVPTIFEIMFALCPDISADMFPDAELVMYGGAPGAAETITAMGERFGVKVMACYGASEVSGFCSYTSRQDPAEKAVSLGKPPAGVEMKLVDSKTKQDIKDGEIGEIAVRSEMVFDRYLGMPEETREAFSDDGWFYTGDLARLDDEGFYHIAGRSKEMYICGGFNVYPKEVEDKLTEHPQVSTAAVIGMPHKKMGEIGWAFIVPVPGSSPTEVELLDHCRKKMADYKVPERIFFESAIPISPIGKILKNQLKDMAMSRIDS